MIVLIVLIAHEFYVEILRIKTHLDNTLYLSSLWSDLSCATELVISGAPAGFLFRLDQPGKALEDAIKAMEINSDSARWFRFSSAICFNLLIIEL